MTDHATQKAVGSEASSDTLTILVTKNVLATKIWNWDQVRQEPACTGYGKAARFSVTSYRVSGIYELADILERLQRNAIAFVIRGSAVAGTNRSDFKRRLHAKKGEPATIEPAARCYVAFDIDRLDCPEHIDPVHEPDEVVEHVIAQLPPEFDAVTCFWSFTSSHGIKPGIRLRLWFWLDRPLEDWELKSWLDGYPVDHAVFAPAQPIYTAAPIFRGMPDPCPRRCGLRQGENDEVSPPVIERPAKARAKAAGSGTYSHDCGGGYDGYRAQIGDHEGGGGFHGPIKSAVAAWMARNGAETDPSWLRADLEAAIRAADRSKHADSYIELRVYDLDPLIASIRQMQAAKEAEAGPEVDVSGLMGKARGQAAPEPLVPTFDGADEVILAEGERLAAVWSADFMARVRGWYDWPGDQITPERGEVVEVHLPGGIDFNDPPPEPGAPCSLLNATLALGKTEIIAAQCAEVPATKNCNVFCRDHALVSETAERIRAKVGDKHRVLPIYGRTQLHPDGGRMCSQAALAEAVQSCGQSVEEKLCKHEVSPGVWEHCADHPDVSPGCRYQHMIADKRPAIRVLPHAYLTIDKGNPAPNDALNMIDEDPIDSLIHDGNGYGVPIWVITKTEWIIAGRKHLKQTGDSLTFQFEIADYSKWLSNVLSEDNPTPEMLRKAGLDAGKARRMAGYWYDIVDDLAVTPAMPRAKKEEAIAAYRTQIALKMGKLWTLIHDVVEMDVNEIRCIRIQNDVGKNLETVVLMVWSSKPKITGPVAIFDGTADEEVTGRFFPRVEVTTINVRAEHYHSVQVSDRAVSKNMLGYGLDKLDLKSRVPTRCCAPKTTALDLLGWLSSRPARWIVRTSRRCSPISRSLRQCAMNIRTFVNLGLMSVSSEQTANGPGTTVQSEALTVGAMHHSASSAAGI
ncbi:MAG: hypothetical protein WCO00_16850 [Rhodospirillaceae bacterium]